MNKSAVAVVPKLVRLIRRGVCDLNRLAVRVVCEVFTGTEGRLRRPGGDYSS